jgi:hypothetical protein
VEAGSPAVWALVLGGVAMLFTGMVAHLNRIERRTVEAARSLLPNHTSEKKGVGHRFTGRVDGVEITLRLYQRFGETEVAGPWTEVLLDAPQGVSLKVRPKDVFDEHFSEPGLAIASMTGDSDFSSKFVVDVSPPGLAPRILDADLRRRLIELESVRILPQESGGLRVVKRRWDKDTFKALTEAGARLSKNLTAATEGQ